MIARRTGNAFTAILGLVVFVSWLGTALFHFHEGAAPACKVCQALQANQADVPVQGAAPEPLQKYERLAGSPSPSFFTALLLVPEGRAPPLA